MAHDRAGKIDDALIQLVDALLPPLDDEDEESLDERRDEATDKARETINRYGGRRIRSDITEVRDAITKRLHRQGHSADDLVTFSNLVSRLQTKPVLSSKAEILELFYRLTPLPSPAPEPATAETGRSFSERQRDRSSYSAERQNLRSRDGAKTDAFSLRTVISRHETHGEDGHERREPAKAREPEGRSVSRSGISDSEPSEAALLRDLPYMLQGVSSETLSFTQVPSIQLQSTLPVPIVSLLHSLAEPSLLYQQLSAFVKSHQEGSILQSLQAAIGKEVQSYLGLVATIDGEIRRALIAVEQDSSRAALGKTGVTLKRCVYWTREATMGLRLMGLIVEESHDKKGGQLISLVYGFNTSNGDPFVRAFADRLLSHITRSFYDMLRQWIYDGELSDPFTEFFVSEQSIEQTETNPDTRTKTGGASVWEDKYHLDESMIPSIMTHEFAKKVFLIGKSLNFIRHGCGDAEWVESYSKSKSTELRYGDTVYLESSIGAAYETTMAQLIHLMEDKFHLSTHLAALKKFLLLGQGDFIALLMESLSSSLDRPTNTLYRHNLTAQLEDAIRGSNAQFSPPEVLRRLDARMLEASHGDVGWDAFTLEYKIFPPLDVVVSPWGAKQYLKVFNFLWRVKRVEFALGTTWRHCMTGARGVLSNFSNTNIHPTSPSASTSSSSHHLTIAWKRARATIAEMIHFVAQLQYYILFEVIEASWDQLQASIRRPGCTLDDLIDAHTTYLRAITHKGLLGGSSSKAPTGEEGFLTQLHNLLKTMLSYRDAVEGLYSLSVAEFSLNQDPSSALSPTTAKAPSILPTSSPSSSQANPLLSRLTLLAADFKARLSVLLGDLAHQQDVDMRFLGVVMNFNDFYENTRRRRRGLGAHGSSTSAAAGAAGPVEREREREREKKTPRAPTVGSSGTARG